MFAHAIALVPFCLRMHAPPSPPLRLYAEPPPSPFARHTHTAGITEADLLASVCHRYSTVQKLLVKPTSSPERKADLDAAVLVEIRFAGPQPSESCGALLCLLLGGDSVQAWPVELPRGRRRKSTVTIEEAKDAAAPPGN